MKAIFSLGLLIVSLFLENVNGHMWLRSPVSVGGLAFAGGTTGPCAGRSPGSGQRTTYEVGQSVTFQFRVNAHGPAPFRFALATTGTNFDEVIEDNISNDVTAGPDGFDGVNVKVTIPNKPCEACTIQLSGMGDLSGKGKWYNCADIQIVAAGSLGLPFPSSIQPSSAPTSGGTLVAISGTQFGSAAVNPKCKFDVVEVPATWVSSTEVTCIVPPRNEPGTIQVEVSLDGTKFSTTGTSFTYSGAVIRPVITRVEPESGAPGTQVTITGQNFFSSAMVCRFKGKVVVAEVLGDGEAVCTVPEFTAEELKEEKSVALEVSVDGSPYSTSGATFEMTAAASSLSFSSFLLGAALALVLVFMI